MNTSFPPSPFPSPSFKIQQVTYNNYMYYFLYYFPQKRAFEWFECGEYTSRWKGSNNR